jgi:hypothetical protein
MNFLGLEIERKTNLLTLTAFVISITTLIYQIGTYLVGPSARLLPPDGITLLQFSPTEDTSYLSVLAPVAVANQSSSRQPLLVRRYRVELVYGEQRIFWEWHLKVGKVNLVDGRVKVEDVATVTPFIVDSKKVDASFFLFVPHARTCSDEMIDDDCNRRNGFIDLADFSSMAIEQLRVGSIDAKVTLYADFDGHESRTVSCRFPFTHAEYVRLVNHGYVSVLCS